MPCEMSREIVRHPFTTYAPMPKLYLFEIASTLIAVTLLVADCRHMMTDSPSAPQWPPLQTPSAVGYLLASQAAGVERTDVIRQISGLSMLAVINPDHPRSVAQ